MAAIEVDLSNYVTTREYEAGLKSVMRELTSMHEALDAGFTETHRKQDMTNGRLLKAEDKIATAEGKIALLNQADLGTADLAGQVDEIRRQMAGMDAEKRILVAAKRIVIGAGLSVVGGITVGLTIALVKHFAGWP